jgi:hypothetical protein
MARKGLVVLLCAAVFAAARLLPAAPPGPAAAPAAPDDDKEKKLLHLLAVQKALQEGRDCLKRGDFQAAVAVLEARVAYIDGNKDYLDALRDAYVGYIRELRQGNRAAEAPTYLRRLECCDPGALLELNAAPAKAAAADRPPPAPAKAEAAPAKAAEAASAADPFDDRNARRYPEAKALLDRAEQEFAAKHYAEAGRLYEQCQRAEPSVAADAKAHWAYCKLYAAVEVYNDAVARNAAAPPELEKDVRLAMNMAPDNQLVDTFGKNLLGKLQERRGGAVRGAAPDRVDDAPPAVEVRHTPRADGQQWAVCETANFRFFHNQPRETAEKAARVAEAARAMATKKWFGEAGAAWSPKCDVYLHATAQDYSTATGVPAESPGHSTISRAPNSDRIVARKIDLHADDPNMLIGVLPHETTHVVLAGRFGPRDIPRWADEGMAVLSEPRERVELHLRNLPKHRSEGMLFPTATLTRMEKYPEPRAVGAFYAESVSLVEFLSKEKGTQVFSQFLHEALDGGYEPALQKYYGIKDFNELDQRWQRYAFDAGVADKGK